MPRVLVALLLLAAAATAAGPSPREAFDKADKNHDGKVTRNEVPPEGRKLFAACDANRDGAVTLAEFVDVIRRVVDPNATADSARKPEDSIRVLPDIPYADTANPRQRLDLALPKDPASRSLPLVVFIHGGGWVHGEKKDGGLILLNYVAGGDFAAATINYRYSTEAPWPAQIHDCKAAVRWLRAHAKEHGVDPDRIGVMGVSAGGHLVSLLGTTSGDPALEGDLGACRSAGSQVSCVVNYCGPTNLLTAAVPGAKAGGVPVEELLATLLGGPVSQHTQAAREASAVMHISKGDPPFLIAHGTHDEIVPFDQSVKFHAALRREGVDSLFISIKGGGHNILPAPGLDERVKHFFERHLLDREVTIPTTPITMPR